jgi:TP901 family phage tail tape measure protein
VALHAGSVYSVLGGRFDPTGFKQFDAAMIQSRNRMVGFERDLDRSTKRSSKSFLAMGAVARGGAAVGVGALALGLYGLSKVVVSSVAQAASFEKQMSSLRAVTKAGASDMQRFKDQALALGAATGLGAGQAAKAQIELAKGGLTVAQILEGGLQGALALAAAGELDVAEAAMTTANALNLFGLSGDEAIHVADALSTAANKTTADVGDFGLALTQGGSAAKAAGLSLDETVVALEALASIGIKGSDAGTSLKAALTQLASPTKKAADLTRELGLKLFDAHGNMRPLPQVADQLRDKLGGLTRQQRLQAITTLVGTDGMRALLALYDAGPEKIEGLREGVKEQGVATEAMRQKQEGAAGAMNRLSAAWESAKIILGSEVLPPLAEAADKLGLKLGEMAEDGTLEDLGASLGAVAGALPALVEAFNAGIDAIGGFVDFSRGAADTILGLFSSVIGAAAAMVGALDAIPDPFNVLPDFSKAAKGLDDVARTIDETRRRVRGVATRVDIELALKGEGSVRQKLEKLAGMELPPKLQEILASDASARQKLRAIEAFVLRDKIQEILASDGPAREKLAALRALKLPRKLQEILASDGSARQKLQAIRAYVLADKRFAIKADASQAMATIGAVSSVGIAAKTVTINARKGSGWNLPLTGGLFGRAAGRGPSGAETAVVGEGRAHEWRVNPRTGEVEKILGPQLRRLAPDDFIIPTEPAYRGRGLDLLRMLAGDLGVPGFRSGRKPKKRRFIPKPRDPLALPVDEVEQLRDRAKEKYDDARRTEEDLERDAKGSNRGARAKARSKLPSQRQRVAKLKAEFEQRKREATEARKYAGLIKEQEDLVDIARLDMEDADRRNDDPAYREALRGRRTALAELGRLLSEALKHVKPGSAYGRELRKAIGTARNDLGELPAEGAPVPTGEDFEALTPEQQKRLEDIERDIALAELTQPLDDDRSAIGALVSFREGILSALQAQGAPSSAIGQAARDLKSAREQLSALSESITPDLQAQLDQANERLRIEAEGRRVSDLALATFQGAGDLGLHVPAQQTSITVNTLHPGDPALLEQIGRAATAGQSLQGSRRSPRTHVGL